MVPAYTATPAPAWGGEPAPNFEQLGGQLASSFNSSLIDRQVRRLADTFRIPLSTAVAVAEIAYTSGGQQ